MVATAENDPVCGMEVTPASAVGRSEHGGKTYYFCSTACKEKFDAAPQSFAGGSGEDAAAPAVVEGAPLNGNRHTRSTPDGAGERVDLPITGMTCAACARRIERKLSRVPGVGRSSVNFATSRATVEYDPDQTGVRQLIDTVREVGYGTAGTARAEFVVDDSARPSGTSVPLEQHLNRLRA